MGQENSILPMISESVNQFAFTEGIFIFTIVMNIPDSSMKNLDSLKDLLKSMKTINGQKLKTPNGFQRKMQ